MPKAANVMYSAPPVYCEASTSPSNTPDVPPTPTVHRVANMEAMVFEFLAEHSLSFTLSDKLIYLSLEISKDSPALKQLKMHCTTALYKLTHGLALVLKNELIDHMKVVPFKYGQINLNQYKTCRGFS